MRTRTIAGLTLTALGLTLALSMPSLRGPRSQDERSQMDWNARRPDLRFALAIACLRGGLRLRGIEGEVRERLCCRLEQGHEPGPLRRRPAQRKKRTCPGVISSCFLGKSKRQV